MCVCVWLEGGGGCRGAVIMAGDIIELSINIVPIEGI